MAESTVSFVPEKLWNLLIEEANFLRGVRDQVEQMQMELRQMRAFLQDAESNTTTGQAGESKTNMLRELTDVAYDVEDVVDTYILEMHHHRRRRSQQGFVGFIKRYGCILQECIRLRRTGVQIEQINASLQKITEMKSRYHILDGGSTGVQQQGGWEVNNGVQGKRALALRREMNVIVGFEDEMEKIMESLLDHQKRKPRRHVISVVGMGGAGKTTLIRRICNKKDVKDNFVGPAMVTVSQTWSPRHILEDIAVEFLGLSRETMQKMDDRKLQDKVLESLQGKRYLIVFDDVWTTEVWSQIGPHLPDNKNGSRVIITTRNMDVANYADASIEAHQLRLLREDESWELFTKIVFPGHDDDEGVTTVDEEVCTGELKDLGQKICKDCGGLPLAIILMGGLLSKREKSPIAWADAMRGIGSWEDVQQGMLPKVLALSYRDLPHHLKLCFLYLSRFPEDWIIDVERLITQLVAEGLVPEQVQSKNQSNSYITMEETAEGWMGDLVRRCMVQAVERTAAGMLVACRLHDALRDLSIKEAEKVNFFHTWQPQEVASSSNIAPPVPATTRRLAVMEGHGINQFLTLGKLRTLFYICSYDEELTNELLRSLRLLRVLELQNSKCRKLPEAIGDLIHLRYLGLRRCHFLESIPSSVGNLQNLQTLDVLDTGRLENLPESLWGIGTLRHLILNGNVPHISQQLVHLQTLRMACAGSWMYSSLAMLTSLRTLSIHSITEAHHPALSDSLDSLVHLRYLHLLGGKLPRKALALPNNRRLQTLELYGMAASDEKPPNLNHPVPVYTSDEMPPNLTELRLIHYKLQQDPFLLLHRMPYLKRLSLHNGYNGEDAWLCSTGGFPQLEMMSLHYLRNLRQWTIEEGALPRLKHLSIWKCTQLEMLPDGLQHLKTLQELEIKYMPDEFEKRLRRGDEGGGGEDCHKIQHIPHVRIGTEKPIFREEEEVDPEEEDQEFEEQVET